MSATHLPYTYQPTWAKKRGPQDQIVPFSLFFILICTPGFTNIASANLSVLLFPMVLYGYSAAAKTTFFGILPGARKLATFILSTMLIMCAWDFVTAVGAPEFLRVFRPIYGHASGLTIVIGILALSRTPTSAGRTRKVCLILLTLCLAATYFIGNRGYGDRYPGFFKHPNQLGPVSAMAALFLFCQMISVTGRRKAWSLLGLIIAIYAMLLSGSKTNLISVCVLFLVSVILLALQQSNKSSALLEIYRNLIMAMGLIVVGALALSLTNERAFGVIDSLSSGDEEVNQYQSVVARDGLWKESLQMVERYPLTGVGAGQLMSDGTEHSHNVFMDAMRTTGVPGFALTTGFILGVLWYVYGAYGAARRLGRVPGSRMSEPGARGPLVGSLMALISYLISNQMSDSFGPSTIPFFYLFFAFSLTFLLPGKDGEAWKVSS